MTVISAWGLHLYYALSSAPVQFGSLLMYLHIVLQTYLYTGLFITGHDAMHGTIYRNKRVNRIFGTISCFLYAGLSYNRLIKNHFMHHKSPGTADDPDYNISSQNFWIWWGTFMVRYTTITQLVVMSILFNLLKYLFSEPVVWVYWVLPAILSSLQLFYFGTYRPHMLPHTAEMQPHNARSQKLNHLWAMLSCYFFGYHLEHHHSPGTPWWQLYRLKEQGVQTK